jgi:hypothetical protein
MSMEFVTEHQRLCRYGTISPFIIVPGIHCDWRGPQTEVKDHTDCENYHNVIICEVNDLSTKYQIYTSKTITTK